MYKKKVFCIFKNDLKFISKTETRRIYDLASQFICVVLTPKNAYVEEKVKKVVKNLYQIPIYKEKNLFLKIINLLIYIIYSIKYVKKENPDIIYTPPTSVIIIGFICKKILKKKWIVDLYDPPISAIKRKPLENIFYTIGSKILKTMINSSDMVAVTIIPESVKWLNTKNVIYLTNGCDIENYKSYRNNIKTKVTISDNTLKIVSIETSIKNAGIEYIFKALKIIVQKSTKKIKLIFVGYLDGKEEIEKLAKEYNLEDYIEYKGKVPSENLPELLKNCDIGVLHLPSGPHRDETYPLKVFEFMAAGLAIVAFRLMGVAKILTHGENAILVAPDNPEALAEGLLRVINDDHLRESLKRKALEKSIFYDWKFINSKFIEALKAL